MLIMLIGGLAFLITGAELLVRYASRLSLSLGVSPLIVGLTIVAFGTSSPELAVNIRSALAGNSDIAVGNIVGSNIFNVLFILGASALMSPLVIHSKLVKMDVPIMIGVSVLLLLFSLDGRLGPLEGLLFFLGAMGYTLFSIWEARREKWVDIGIETTSLADKPTPAFFLQVIFFIILGLALLIIGANWLVFGAVALAAMLGVSDSVIALTIVAAGTSLPEVATSCVAAYRKQLDIAVGNVVGSNIFNILAILGISALIPSAGLPLTGSVMIFDIPFMVAVCVVCLPLFISGNVLSRWEGGFLLLYYAVYVIYLIAQDAEILLPSLRLTTLVTIPLILVAFLSLIPRKQKKKPDF